METAMFRLRLILVSFLHSIAVQYAFVAPEGSKLPDRWRDLVRSWTALQEGSHQAWLPQFFRDLDRLSVALETLRDRYERELGSQTVSLIDAFLHHWRENEGLRLRSTYELAKSIAPVFDVPEPDGKTMTSQQLVSIEAVIGHAVRLCERYEEISDDALELDDHANEQFRLAQVARRAAVTPDPDVSRRMDDEPGTSDVGRTRNP
jgi:hypothetical protein